MKVFTPRFIKDIIILLVLWFVLYTLVNNPITHPKLPKSQGTWSIQLMQYPLVFGIAGHNYLVLRDNNNNIVKELHGLATSNTTGLWKYVGEDPTDVLKVWEFDSPHYYVTQKGYPGISLYQGTKDQAESIWLKGLLCKDDINNENIPYPMYGVNLNGDTENSNSVAYTLLTCMGLDAKHLGLITPGWGKNLLRITTSY